MLWISGLIDTIKESVCQTIAQIIDAEVRHCSQESFARRRVLHTNPALYVHLAVNDEISHLNARSKVETTQLVKEKVYESHNITINGMKIWGNEFINLY